jgi:hypothetical protein
MDDRVLKSIRAGVPIRPRSVIRPRIGGPFVDSHICRVAGSICVTKAIDKPVRFDC